MPEAVEVNRHGVRTRARSAAFDSAVEQEASQAVGATELATKRPGWLNVAETVPRGPGKPVIAVGGQAGSVPARRRRLEEAPPCAANS